MKKKEYIFFPIIKKNKRIKTKYYYRTSISTIYNRATTSFFVQHFWYDFKCSNSTVHYTNPYNFHRSKRVNFHSLTKSLDFC